MSTRISRKKKKYTTAGPYTFVICQDYKFFFPFEFCLQILPTLPYLYVSYLIARIGKIVRLRENFEKGAFSYRR